MTLPYFSSLARVLTGVLLCCWSLVAWPQPKIAVLDPGHAQLAQALGMADAIVLMPTDPLVRQGFARAQTYQHKPALESLLVLQPDWLIGGNPVRDRAVLKQAKRLGVATYMLDRSLPLRERISVMAELLKVPERGGALVQRMELSYAQAAKLAQGRQPIRVLHISSSGAGRTGVTGAGSDTPAHRLIEGAGGLNVGAEFGLTRYQRLSAEGVMIMAPEVVLVSDLELASLGGEQHIWQQVLGLAHTPAGQHRRLVVLEHGALKFDAIGSGEATLLLAKALHQP